MIVLAHDEDGHDEDCENPNQDHDNTDDDDNIAHNDRQHDHNNSDDDDDDIDTPSPHLGCFRCQSGAGDREKYILPAREVKTTKCFLLNVD